MSSMPGIDIDLTGVHIQEVVLSGSFLETAEKFAHIPGTVVLLSGGDLDCARYHILATKPWLSVKSFGSRVTLTSSYAKHDFPADPFQVMQSLLTRYQQSIDTALPVAAGFFGYLAYDLKDHLERLPRTCVDDLKLPQLCLFAPAIILIQDRQTDQTFLCVPRRKEGNTETWEADLLFFEETIQKPAAASHGYHIGRKAFTANFSQNNYMQAICDIREYIAAGHVYQVNMSQRFESEFSGNAFDLFMSLYDSNPAPFFAYIEAGDHRIVSTSPERFIRQTGDRIETRPIKGTRPRGTSPEEDTQMRESLLTARKDDAELSMIVDLLRNDIGKVCTGGSVQVVRHKQIEAYENVFHLVSIVEGTLAPGKDAVDLIRAVFPGGSITGCPKIRAMEIIDELEPCRRHIYTGSIGYIGFHQTMDLSIAIRTATIADNRIVFSAGGGIVYDSDPLAEYEETLHKGRTLMNVLQACSKPAASSGKIWINGRIIPEEMAAIPVTDLGVQYGYGLFETIRASNSKTAYLPEHIDRFNTAWEKIMPSEPPDLTWEDVIQQVLAANGLQDKTAAVKMMATFGTPGTPRPHPNLIVTARPYTHRLDGKKDPGIHLITCPDPRQTPLADYKTMNYLYYYLAGRYAAERQGDEALILNPDGSLSETNTANILLVKGKEVLLPKSAAVLSGIMEKVICRYLKTAGFTILEATIFQKDLFTADQVMITNSLIGAVPVLSLDQKKLPADPRLCEKINNHVL